MLNKVKVSKFEVWDADTGEATVEIEVNNNKLTVFSLEHFEESQTYQEAVLSLFCNDFEIKETPLDFILKNTDKEYQVEIQGLIVDFNSGDEYGDIITVDAGNIYVDVYVSFENMKKHNVEMGLFFKGIGRLDLELPV